MKPGKATRHRRWKRALIALLIAGSLFEAGLLGVVIYTEKVIWPVEPADAIIVLGARVMPEGDPSLMLQYRLDKALEMYHDGYAGVVIACGAQGSDEPAAEADVMAEYLIARGVLESAVIREVDSYSTIENLQNAQAIMAERGFSRAIVVTTDYHMRRAMWLCEDIGLAAMAAPAMTPGIPSTYLESRLRETLSWIKYFLTR